MIHIPNSRFKECNPEFYTQNCPVTQKLQLNLLTKSINFVTPNLLLHTNFQFHSTAFTRGTSSVTQVECNPGSLHLKKKVINKKLFAPRQVFKVKQASTSQNPYVFFTAFMGLFIVIVIVMLSCGKSS